jgi:hypothetical protein
MSNTGPLVEFIICKPQWSKSFPGLFHVLISTGYVTLFACISKGCSCFRRRATNIYVLLGVCFPSIPSAES